MLGVDEPQTVVGEERRAADQTRALLWAALGRESSDAATLQRHGRADRVLPLAAGVVSATGTRKPRGASRGIGEVSEESHGE